MARALGPRARGAAVGLLQEKLAVLGFYVGPVDGVYGELTQDAVRRFQRAFRLTCDGVAGPQVLSLLRDPMLAAPGGDVRAPGGDVGAPGEEVRAPDAPAAFPEPVQAPGGMPACRLLVGWEPLGDTPLPHQQWEAAFGPLSGWVRAWAELVVEPGLRPACVQPAPQAEAPAGPLMVDGLRLDLRLPASLARLAAARAARAVETARARRIGPDGPAAAPGPILLLMAGRWEVPWAEPPGGTPVGLLFHLARLLARRHRVWVALPAPAPARASARSLFWWGYQVGRLAGPVERLVAWLSPPAPEEEMPPLGGLKPWVRGLAAFSPPWRVLLGFDLAPWWYPSAEAAPTLSPRRLSHSEAVLWAWRLRRAGGARAGPGRSQEQAEMGRLGCRDAAWVRALAQWVRWAGLGGVVVAGLQRADPRAREALRSALSPLLVRPSGIWMMGERDGPSVPPGGLAAKAWGGRQPAVRQEEGPGLAGQV